MKSLSIDSQSFFTPYVAPSRGVRGTPLSVVRPNHSPRQPLPMRASAPARFDLADDHVSDGISLGLVALTLPAVAYAICQLWHLVGGETLTQAVRAFAP